MPIRIPSFLISTGQTVPFLLEDTLLRGGFRSVLSIGERDSIAPSARKIGMLVHVRDNDTMYQLLNDGTWINFWERGGSGGGGGGGGASLTAELPLSIDVDRVLRINPGTLLPGGGAPGQALVLNTNAEPVWGTVTGGGSGARLLVSYTTPQLGTGQFHDFDLDMAKTCMLLNVEVDASDLLVQAFTDGSRSDPNPYTFKSRPNLFKDEGITYDEDDSPIFGRRYSFVSNLDTSPTIKISWRVTNLSALPRTCNLQVTFLTLE